MEGVRNKNNNFNELGEREKGKRWHGFYRIEISKLNTKLCSIKKNSLRFNYNSFKKTNLSKIQHRARLVQETSQLLIPSF